MDNEPTPLDYRAPHDAPRRPVFSVAAFLASAAVVAVLLLDLLVIVPRFEEIFRDFGTKLPAITQLLLDVSRVLADSGRWVVLAMMPLAIGFLAPLLGPVRIADDSPTRDRPPRRRHRSMTLVLMSIALCVILAVTIVALALPMLSLINAVSGK